MDKVTINEYDITNPNIKSNKKIAFLSDVHSDSNKFEQILEILYNSKIDILLIGGDLVDSLADHRKNIAITDLLIEFSKYAFIFISEGNHDIVCSGKKSELKFWSNISKINNIYLSEFPKKGSTVSQWSIDNNIDICIINIPLSYYIKKEEYNDFNNQIRIMDKTCLDINKYNILLCHSPNNLVKGDKINEYIKEKNVNLILSGHMHGGLIPNCIRKNTYGSGLIGPYESLFPSYAYGVIKDDNISILTTGGVVKIVDRNSGHLKSILDIIYPPEIEILNLNNNKENGITKVKRKHR